MIEQVPKCRFCNASEGQSIKGETVYGGAPEQHFYECSNCQIIYLYPPLSKKEEAKFYRKEFEKFMEGRGAKDKNWSTPETHFLTNQDEAQRRMSFLQKYLNKKQNILEIGCSSGFMLSALKDSGAVTYGIDPSNVFIEYVRSKGIEAYQSLEEMRTANKKKFDLILHYYVLEHIRNPIQFITSKMKLLKHDGKMIFEIPCATDPLIELYNVPAFDLFYWSVAHNWYFRKESLVHVLNKAGFKYELFPEQRYDLSNHITWMTDGKPGGMKRYNNVFGDDLDLIYKQSLKDRWLCDTIVAVLYNEKI